MSSVFVFHGVFREVGGCSVETLLLSGDLFKDSNLDVTGIEGKHPAAP